MDDKTPRAEESLPNRRQVPKKAGLVSVARALGVSPSTVSNAYNRPDQLSPALRERVLDTAAKLGYAGPDPVARSLRSGRAGAVGVVFYERLPYAFADPAAVLFLQGVSEVIDERQLAMVLVPGPWDRISHASAVRGAGVDGFIAHGMAEDDPLLAATLERRLPTVIVDSHTVDGLDFVGIDDRAAAATAVRHLLDLGHREIGIMSFRITNDRPPRHAGSSHGRVISGSVGERRLEGCARAIEAADLSWSEVPLQGCAVITVEEGRAAAHALLDRAPQITALFAFSDVLALGARAAANERGLSVPGDLSIIGFDGTAPAAERLTSVHQRQFDKGRMAAERLVRTIDEGRLPPRIDLLETHLVLRGSTAPPKTRRAQVRPRGSSARSEPSVAGDLAEADSPIGGGDAVPRASRRSGQRHP